MTKKWTIEYKDEPMWSLVNGKQSECHGYYLLKFEGAMYGTFGKESFENMKTGEVLILIEQMLNDAYDLALKQHD